MANKCIYCNNESNLTESDIIPFALTAKKMTRKNVCDYHNARINDEAEKEAISSLLYVRKIIGLRTRKDQDIPYPVDVIINGDKYKVENYADLFSFSDKAIDAVNENGDKFLIGRVPDDLDLVKNKVQYFSSSDNISIIMESDKMKFCSEPILRMVAKIGYEWYCNTMSIKFYDKKFQPIVDYIMRETDKTAYPELVEVVVSKSFYEQIYNSVEIGSHCLSITHSVNGDVYLVYIFMGIVAYKILLGKVSSFFLLRTTRSDFEGFHSDGTRLTLPVPKTLEHYDIPSKTAFSDLSDLSAIIHSRLHSQKSWKILTINSIRKDIMKIKKLYNNKTDSNAVKFDKLFGITDEFLGSVIYVLLKLGENSKAYDHAEDFPTNIRKILGINDVFKISKESFVAYINEKKESLDLLILLRDGLILYDSISKK